MLTQPVVQGRQTGRRHVTHANGCQAVDFSGRFFVDLLVHEKEIGRYDAVDVELKGEGLPMEWVV